MKRPLIAGLVAAISTTHRQYQRQWEALRSLWNHNALTWEEFQWLEHLESVLYAKGDVCLPIPGCPGWDGIVAEVNEAVASSIRFEENRKAHGLQAAFDMRNAA